MKKIIIDSWGRKILVDISSIVALSAISQSSDSFKFDILLSTAHVLNVFFKSEEEASVVWAMLSAEINAEELFQTKK